ncbi:XRE family transcriptional regulator [Lysinibacillus sphaericus]|uniref:XRE family transcriptional regulator n=1 Tax=Lysinibacillus sphaericus TaxID=1421 RepID=A0A544U8F0_LYSSH|nr:helix-turn-helix transcriptional regulator [Lysinibacillus sp. SDF0037]TQR28362.1 XRE family transcriptional regulator [Lysinibacillus sp. SDF0037]
MTTFDRLKKLCEEQRISIVELEEKLDFGRNSLYGWKKKVPNGANLEKVADYFDVSVDYLLGRTDKKRYFDLTKKDEQSIQEELQKMVEGLSKSGHASFDGRTLDELSEEEIEDRELLLSSLENSLRLAKRVAKQKFTPKKYRD